MKLLSVPKPTASADRTFNNTHRAANRWLWAVPGTGALWAIAWAAQHFRMVDVDLTGAALLLLVAALVRHATLHGWCRGWYDRGIREMRNQLLEHR